MEGVITVYSWICLGWAVATSTLLLILEALDYKRHSRMRQAYWDWVYSGEQSRKK